MEARTRRKVYTYRELDAVKKYGKMIKACDAPGVYK